MSELAMALPRAEQDMPGVPGLTLDYRLRWMDFDRYGRMKPASILDLFQDVATLQAEQQGIGHDDMLARGVFWAVIRSKFEIVRQPAHHERVFVRTWPHTPSRFSFLRDFSMRDEDGGLLVRATSEWVFMDAETRKFVRITDILDESQEYDPARAFPEKPRKVHDFATEGLEPVLLAPAYSDIDYNGHVNNAMYANFVVDALNPGEEGALRTFQIDYRQEVHPGEPLAMYTSVDVGTVLAKGLREDGSVLFLARMELA